MSNLESFSSGSYKEEKGLPDKYPIIWKTSKCAEGECREMRTSHRWSIPCSAPSGLMTECYDCHKTRIVEVERQNA